MARTQAPDPIAASGLAVNGRVPGDQTNPRTRFPRVYALGDVCTGPVPAPRPGSSRSRPRSSWADDIAASIAGEEPPAPYGGSDVCYAGFGDGLASKVDVNFFGGPAAAAQRHDPSREFAADKEEFGATRPARWFEQ